MTKPSGSFVAWDNTMCNPLAPLREQTKSAWEDGYASAKTKTLSDTEIVRIGVQCGVIPEEFWSESQIEFARAIEAAHGIFEEKK